MRSASSSVPTARAGGGPTPPRTARVTAGRAADPGRTAGHPTPDSRRLPTTVLVPRRTRRWAVAITVVWAAALIGNRSARRVRGGSMAPTLLPGDLVWVLPVRWLRRGTIVELHDPRRGQRTLKRVVALPGDRVAVRGGVLYRDGSPVQEPYVVRPGGGDLPELVVPAGHVVVLGDHRAASTDSRTYGPVPLTTVTGVVWVPPAPARRRSTEGHG